jgi:sugar lactone lactonase YvrE
MDANSTSVRRLLAVASAVLMTVALAGPLTGSSAHAARPFPTTLELPDGFQPEGIEISGTTAYFGSRATGDIWTVDLRTGARQLLSPGPGTSSLGMKVDEMGRLFVAGGSAGDGRVVDAANGAVLASYSFASSPTFVNDVILTDEAAWFTDSQRPVLYRVSLTGDALPTTFETLPLTGDWEQGAGFGANGITTTPDGSALLVVHSTLGALFRVDPATGVADRVDLGGASVSNGDGLLLIGRTLYVVRNQLNQVAVVRLSSDGLSGEVVDSIVDPRFDIPTTVAAFGNLLYLPNARFTTPPTPATTYTAVGVSR